MGLRIQIDDERRTAALCKQRGKIQRGRRFTDAAFLIENYDSSHEWWGIAQS
jgi:hypothetical protein